MRVRGLVGGRGRLGRWPDVGVAIVTSAAGGGCGRLLGQSGEQPADLVAGQRDQLVVPQLAATGLGGGQDGQERVGEQGQDGPAVPGGPAADLVLVQGGQFLAGGEPVLDSPPGSGHPHQLRQWHRAGARAR